MFEHTSLIKSDSGDWYLQLHKERSLFYFAKSYRDDNGQTPLSKAYYSAEEVKAQGMQWVTIRGTHVLIKPLAEGGYVVVGGAGGRMNHLKIDKIASEADYKAKRKKVEAKRKEELKDMTKEDIKEQVEKKKVERAAKQTARSEYTQKIQDILGVTQEDLKEQISAKDMDEIATKARDMVEARSAKPVDLEAAVEAQQEKEIQKEVAKKVKDVERQAIETLMGDYAPSDPNMKSELKKLLNTEKATEVLMARKEFKKQLKEIGKDSADVTHALKVGDVVAGETTTPEDVMKDIEDMKELSNNVELYDRLNTQSRAIQSHIDQGAVSALNGLLGDVYGSGATFSTDTVENLGLEAITRAVVVKMQADGLADTAKKALTEYAAAERGKVVENALRESKERFDNAKTLRGLARDTDDAEAILSMASANGHALKQVVAGQRALGTAVGSLRAVAHMISALDDPPADVVQVDVGKDLSRARDKAKAAGLVKGTYSIKTKKEGRAKRLVLEIPKDAIKSFMDNSNKIQEDADELNQIKSYKKNDGSLPPGMNPKIQLTDAQEAGLRFFQKQGKVLLDFEAGLGKTAVGYAAAMDMINNKGAKKVLIVTPAKLRNQMAAEKGIFLDEDNQKLVNNSEGKTKAKRIAGYEKEGITIIGHDQLRTDAAALAAAGYDGIIVDEIHDMTGGGGKSGRFKGMSELANIPMKVGMSGTNIKHKKEELYRKIQWLDPENSLGSMADFNNRYKGLNQGTGMFADAANEAFRKEISQWNYTQKNNLTVKNTFNRISVPLTPSQRSRYAASERKYREDRNNKKPGASAQRDARNYQILHGDPANENAKVQKMVELMRANHDGEKAVIHSIGKKASKAATEAFNKEYGPGTAVNIDGDTSAADIKKWTKSFNDPEGTVKFIAGTKAIEAGFNFQGGGTVSFHLDVPESKASFEQRDKRVHRKGQTRDTTSYMMTGENPLDMRKEDIMKTKGKEMGILGNPREVSSSDDTGFFSLLDKYEAEAHSGKTV